MGESNALLALYLHLVADRQAQGQYSGKLMQKLILNVIISPIRAH